MSECKEYRLGDVADIISERISVDYATLENYISTENMINDFGGVVKAEKIPSTTSVNSFNVGDILFSNIRTYFKKVWLSKFDGTVSPDVLVFRPKNCDRNYLYYQLCNPEFTEYTVLTSKGAKMPRGDKDAILNYQITLPPLSEQIAIASILSSLDDKIDLLQRQNAILEKMAETLFKQWFVEEAKAEWEEKPLSSIAKFLNGLACQKFPPKNDTDKLPVLKIKDLSNGITDNSDWAIVEIPADYIVDNGDVIFAWSASLMVKIWNGDRCVLNQHLFKVTSEDFPKWFYYLWCKHHLEQFIAIAKAHATTMGHIKRGDLDEAKVLIPNSQELVVMTEQVEPLIERTITNNIHINTLTKLRDLLLPRLMSGEVKIN